MSRVNKISQLIFKLNILYIDLINKNKKGKERAIEIDDIPDEQSSSHEDYEEQIEPLVYSAYRTNILNKKSGMFIVCYNS